LRRDAIAPAAALAAWLACGAAQAQDTPNLDTPYVPSTPVAVDEMLRTAGTGPGDYVVDLGSGDGRVVIAAARDYGARGLGIELDPKLVELARANARAAGVEERVAFRQGDVLKADFGEATVVTVYLLPNLVERLKARLYGMRPGTRIVAHDYGFSDWKPDRRVVISKNYLLYVVPAKVAGRWSLQFHGQDYPLELKQSYQEIQGGATVPGGYLPAFEARLQGERISFVLVDGNQSHRFEGRVRGTLEMEGEVRSGTGRKLASAPWRATRIVRGGGEE